MMKLMQIKSHWTPDEAHSLLTWLDELREAIWQTYGQDIIDYHRQEQLQHNEVLENSNNKNPF